MNKVYLITITYFEAGYSSNEDDITRTMKAFDSEEKAHTYLEQEFHRLCDENNVDELGEYEYFNEDTCSFHLQDNFDDSYCGDWYVDADMTILDVE